MAGAKIYHTMIQNAGGRTDDSTAARSRVRARISRVCGREDEQYPGQPSPVIDMRLTVACRRQALNASSALPKGSAPRELFIIDNSYTLHNWLTTISTKPLILLRIY
jgi:hypothetical protein